MSELLPAAPRPTPFAIVQADAGSAARCGRLQTAHGAIDTPTFMPVATQGTVKETVRTCYRVRTPPETLRLKMTEVSLRRLPLRRPEGLVAQEHGRAGL